MTFRDHLREQLQKHPVMQPQDVVKLCYQAAFGAEHLLKDPDRAKAYFDQEYALVEAKDMPLYEWISPQVCRMNLCAWKQTGMPAEWLWRMFADTASVAGGSKEVFLEYLKEAQLAVEQGETEFSPEQWNTYLVQYQEAGMPSVHHSQTYRDAEQPAYRIVRGDYVSIVPVLQQAAAIMEKCLESQRAMVIAIDGRAAAGKTTMCRLLERILEAGVVHMDDFFLPPSLRTDSRFAEPGGNVHYERFAQEVLPFVGQAEAFAYQIFDCAAMEYHGCREVKASLWRVVEGSYSLHPVFGEYADVKVFLDVDAEEQHRRIVARNGEAMAKIFAHRWIPLEEAYFEQWGVKEKADIVMGTVADAGFASA